jgi:CRISPR type I-E-associated protein CasB/Cse2
MSNPWFSGAAYAACKAWWCGLEEHKSDRAKLRRISDPNETLIETQYTHELLHTLTRLSITNDTTKVGIIALALSQILHDTDKSLGFCMGRFLKQSRFLTVVHEEDPLEACCKLRRILPLLQNVAPIGYTAAVLANWTMETKKNLCVDYYHVYKP